MRASELLLAYVREIQELQSAVSLAYWDQRTCMPPRGDTARAAVIGRLERLAFERLISPELGVLLANADARAETDADRALVRYWQREHERKRAVPPDFYQQLVTTCVQAESVWERARHDSDFALFAPHLANVVDAVRRLADYLGYQDSPYDALLEEYEPGMTVARLRELLPPVVATSTSLVRHHGQRESQANPSLDRGPYDLEAQRRLSREVLAAIGYDFSSGRLDDSTHPFTIAMSPGDVRITNRYNADDVFSGLLGALHEGGHALYDQGLPEEFNWTGLDSAASFGIHESQARLWENQVGRSPHFWHYLQPLLERHLPRLASVGPEVLAAEAARVTPSLIRTEADEVTYNLHIALRFELELGLIEGRTRVTDLPQLWQEGMQRYLGVVPRSDREGVLQDVHWAGGMFGYFPSYMLGNLYAAQLFAAVQQAHPHMWGAISQGDFSSVLGWLRAHIHRRGGALLPEELMGEATGHSLSPEPFQRYLSERYGPN